MSNKLLLRKSFTQFNTMSSYKPTVFNQIFWIMRDHILPFIGQLNKYSKKMDCSQLGKILLYAQMSGKESLRDIET